MIDFIITAGATDSDHAAITEEAANYAAEQRRLRLLVYCSYDSLNADTYEVRRCSYSAVFKEEFPGLWTR